jgi:hypothetical protein
MSGFLDFPEYYPDHPNLLRQMIRVGKGVMQGKTNNTGTFTLTANSATTTLTFAAGRVGADTVILWQPTTSNAAGALSGLYESARSVANSTITLTHANNAQNDKTFKYILVG